MQSILSLSTAQEEEEDSSLILVISITIAGLTESLHSVGIQMMAYSLFTNVGTFLSQKLEQFMSGICTQG